MDIEMLAATLEAEQANRDFMNAWIFEGRTYDDPFVLALRYYRSCAEHEVDKMINAQIKDITSYGPRPEYDVWYEVEYWTPEGTWALLTDHDTPEAAEDVKAANEIDWPGWTFRVRKARGIAE